MDNSHLTINPIIHESLPTIKGNTIRQTFFQKKITHILDKTVTNFHRKCDAILSEVEELRKDFMTEISMIHECLAELSKECKQPNLFNNTRKSETRDKQDKKRMSPRSLIAGESSQTLPLSRYRNTTTASLHKNTTGSNSKGRSPVKSSKQVLKTAEGPQNIMSSFHSLITVTHSQYKNVSKEKQGSKVSPSKTLRKKEPSVSNKIKNKQGLQGYLQVKLEDAKTIAQKPKTKDEERSSKSSANNSDSSLIEDKDKDKEKNHCDFATKGIPQAKIKFPLPDERKFSILDVGIGIGASYNYDMMNKVNTKSMGNIVKNKLRGDPLGDIENKYIKAFCIMTGLEIVPLKERIKFAFLNKRILNNLNPREIIINGLQTILNRIEELEEIENEIASSNEKFSIIQTLKSVPSKTAQNVLNFLTHESEQTLRYEPDPIINSFVKLLYILLNEHIPGESEVEYFFETILAKYKVKSIKYLVIAVVYKNIFFSPRLTIDIVKSICRHVEENKVLCCSNELLNINKSLSYLSFSINEIYEYCRILAEFGIEYHWKKLSQQELAKLRGLNEEISQKLKIF